MFKFKHAILLGGIVMLPVTSLLAQPSDVLHLEPGDYCLGNDVPAEISRTVREILASVPTATDASFVESYGDNDWNGRVVHADGQISMIERQYISLESGGLIERFFYRNGNLICGESKHVTRRVPPEGGPAQPVETLLWIAADESFWAESGGEPIGDGGFAYADETWASADDSYYWFAEAVIAPSTDSRYLPLDCKDIIKTFEADMGGVFSCGSMAGYEVQLVEDDLRQALRLTRDGRTDTMWIDASGFNRLGPMLEWRGEMDGAGTFVPHSLIVRAFIDQGDGTEIQRLAIGRLTGDRACFDGWVEVAGNPDHNEDARLLADSPQIYEAACDQPVDAGGASQKRS